jgi:hypothetical protein
VTIFDFLKIDFFFKKVLFLKVSRGEKPPYSKKLTPTSYEKPVWRVVHDEILLFFEVFFIFYSQWPFIMICNEIHNS